MQHPRFSDLSVHVTRRRSRCVLDPNLALSRHGATLVRRLATCAELWIGPEIHNVLDSASTYRREPELLIGPNADRAITDDVPETLRDWMQLRDEAGRWLYWVGDAVRESSLPEDLDDRFALRWEAAAQALDRRLPIEATGPLIAATRDAAALCAVLPAGWILALGAEDAPPMFCRYLEQWGLACEELPATEALVSLERKSFQGLLVESGAAPFAWGGLRLAVLHLLVPNIGRIEAEADFDQEHEAATLLLPETAATAPLRDPLENVQCFWYDLTGPGI